MTTTKTRITKEEYESMIVDADVLVDNDSFIVHVLPDGAQVLYFKKIRKYWLLKSN